MGTVEIIECLGISAEVYDSLIKHKEICWFCSGCNPEALRMKELNDDKLLVVLEKMMVKLNEVEEKLHQKADVKAVEDVECSVKQLENSAKELRSNKNRVQQLEKKCYETGQRHLDQN